MHGGGAGGDGMAAILRLGQSAVGATVHLQWLQHGSATYAARIGAVNPVRSWHWSTFGRS